MSKASNVALADAARMMKVCDECAKIFTAWRHDQRFCQRKCHTGWHSRNQARGAALVPVAMNWRRKRGTGPVKLGEITSVLDRFIMDDQKRERLISAARVELKKTQAQMRERVGK